MSSGGIVYHLRALRFGKNDARALWAGHRAGVKKFLEAWNPKEKNLILIGPSAGYSLPLEFLSRFDRIIAVEPDGLARTLFVKRFTKRVEWIKTPVDFENLSEFFAKIPADSAILFSNLLGQIPFKRVKKMRDLLLTALKPYSWASYHDALSGEGLEFDTELLTQKKRATLAEMKASIYPKIKSGVITVNAHEAHDLFENRKDLIHFYWQWRILPKRTHLIEGVFHVRD